jgi:hypothetical protein
VGQVLGEDIAMNVEFFIIREEWNRYLVLPDKAPLRVRMSPLNFNLEGGKMGTEFSQQLKMMPRPDDKGEPSADQTIQAGDIVKSIEFQRIFESINIYDVPTARKLIIIKPILKTFSMTSKFDPKGDRIYQAEFHLAIAPIDYPPEASELPSKSPKVS